MGKDLNSKSNMGTYLNRYTVIIALLFAVSRVNFHSLYTQVVTPVMQEMVDSDDPYATLEVDYTMSHSDIHKKWKKMVVQLHPDKNREDPDAPEKLSEVNAAWSQIKNPEDKDWYDTYYMFMVVVKKCKRSLRRMNLPVILAAKMMGLPEPEENYLEFVWLQYIWGFIFAVIGQFIPIFMWVYLVPGFIKRLCCMVWNLCMLPWRICWWSTKMTWVVSAPGLKSLFLLYNAWVVFPRADFVDGHYELRIGAFLAMHYLVFVQTDRWWLWAMKWTALVFLEGWLIGSETQ